MNRICCVIIVCLLVSQCTILGKSAPRSRAKRVIGGFALDEGMFPWLAHLAATVPSLTWFGIPISYDGYRCGGSILNDRWILTAAHCFLVPGAPLGIKNPRNWVITVGELDSQIGLWEGLEHLFAQLLDEPKLKIWSVRAEEIIIHPTYDRNDTWLHDIALVRVSESLPIDPGEHSNIAQVNLPSPALGGSDEYRSQWPRPEQRCIMKGWGCTEANGPPSRIAQGAVLPIVHSDTCPFGPIGDTRLCAGYNRRNDDSRTEVGICPGDSGGPLVCLYKDVWLQAGVASYTSAHRPGRVPGVFTRVSYYVDWIEETVLNYEPKHESDLEE